MKYKVVEIQSNAPWSNDFGTFNGWVLNLVRSDGQALVGEINTTPNNPMKVGDVFEADEVGPGFSDGSVKLKRAQKPGFGGKPSSGDGKAQAHGKPRVPYSKALATLRRINEDCDRPEDAMALWLGWLRGDVEEPGPQDELPPF